jgi:hypothetical protein
MTSGNGRAALLKSRSGATSPCPQRSRTCRTPRLSPEIRQKQGAGPAGYPRVPARRRRRVPALAFGQTRVPESRSAVRLPRTNNRSATRPDPLHPVHRHDVGRTRAPDRTAIDDRRYRNESICPLRGRAGAHQSCVAGLVRRNILKLCCQAEAGARRGPASRVSGRACVSAAAGGVRTEWPLLLAAAAGGRG